MQRLRNSSSSFPRNTRCGHQKPFHKLRDRSYDKICIAAAFMSRAVPAHNGCGVRLWCCRVPEAIVIFVPLLSPVYYIYCKLVRGGNTDHHYQYCSTSGERSNWDEGTSFFPPTLCNIMPCNVISPAQDTREKTRNPPKRLERLPVVERTIDPWIGPNANKKIRIEMTNGSFPMEWFSSLE